MKLLFISQYFSFPQSPGGTRPYDLSKAFQQKGIDVTVITTSAAIPEIQDHGKDRWCYFEKNDVKFWVLRCTYNQKMPIRRRLVSFWWFLWCSSVKIIRIKADIVLATSTPLTTSIPAIIKKFISKTPYIFEVRDVWPEGPIQLGYVRNKIIVKILRWSEKFIYKYAAYVVVLSSGMKECITSRIRNIDNIEVIPNISEINRFMDLTHKVDLDIDVVDKKIILYAGTLGPVNNIMYVAEIANRLKELNHIDIIFLIVGDGNEKKKIMRYCMEHNILDVNIYFIDKIPKNALPYLYNISSMGSSFVLDKRIKWDNSANKFFDTLAAGKPILINHRGWQADLIEQENCGYVLPAHPTINDVKLFVSYMQNNELLLKQGENAKKIAKEYFSLDVAVSKYLKVLSIVNVNNNYAK